MWGTDYIQEEDSMYKKYTAASTAPAKTVHEYARHLAKLAEQRYKKLCSTELWQNALSVETGGILQPHGIARQERLISDALALCGSPYHSLSRQNWNESEYKFLAKFTTEEGKQDDNNKSEEGHIQMA